MTDLRHSGKTSLKVSEVSWQLSDEGLVATAGQDVKTIPYASISGLRLVTFAGGGGAQGRATLTSDGHGKHTIGSHHYVSLGNFENRSSSYNPFVRELASRIAAANPQAHFVAGSMGLWLMWLIVCLLVLGLAVMVAVAATEAVSPLLRLVSAAVMVAVAGPLAVRWAIRNLPQSFDPKSIPAGLLV